MDKTLKQIVPMECPVCHKFYFSELTEEDIKILKLTPNTTQCNMCGWYYDLEQQANPDLTNQANKMSLNEYRIWYESKIKQNSSWEYFQDHIGNPTPHKCPVCKKHTFPDELSYEICPICGWEDSGFENEPDYKPGQNIMSYNERLKFFTNQRLLNPKYKWIDEK